MSTAPKDCPICHQDISTLDVVDFNKSCLEAQGIYLPMIGLPIYYYICNHCSYVFSADFWGWSEKDFLDKIYNKDYKIVDPDYFEKRPQTTAQSLLNAFGQHSQHIKHLDYGAGNGKVSKRLCIAGWDSMSFDPFADNNIKLTDIGRFNLITAIEVFEHVPHPDQLMENITQLMLGECFVLFSTLLSDGNLQKNSRINWWYCSPRNGHISLFSKKSLEVLAEKYHVNFGSFSPDLHFFSNKTPFWANHLAGLATPRR